MAIKYIQPSTQPESEVIGSLPLTNPELKEQGVYQWKTTRDQGQGLIYFFVKWHKGSGEACRAVQGSCDCKLVHTI